MPPSVSYPLQERKQIELPHLSQAYPKGKKERKKEKNQQGYMLRSTHRNMYTQYSLSISSPPGRFHGLSPSPSCTFIELNSHQENIWVNPELRGTVFCFTKILKHVHIYKSLIAPRIFDGLLMLELNISHKIHDELGPFHIRAL